jgi:hypothetical protein
MLFRIDPCAYRALICVNRLNRSSCERLTSATQPLRNADVENPAPSAAQAKVLGFAVGALAAAVLNVRWRETIGPRSTK